jgi:hypothetical protein
MKWILLGVLVLVVLGVLGLVVNLVSGTWSAARGLTRRGARTPQMRLPPARCRECQGTGWVNRQPERTFTLSGDGFEDVHSPARPCPACDGTGVVRERRL